VSCLSSRWGAPARTIASSSAAANGLSMIAETPALLFAPADSSPGRLDFFASVKAENGFVLR
jgi:hypothetical protein